LVLLDYLIFDKIFTIIRACVLLQSQPLTRPIAFASIAIQPIMTKLDKNEQKIIVKENPGAADNTRIFIDGSTRSYAVLRTVVIGFGTYQPGWRWSLHAGPQVGMASENHIGYIISGSMMVKDLSGKEEEIEPGFAFEIAPGSDAWVIGDSYFQNLGGKIENIYFKFS